MAARRKGVRSPANQTTRRVTVLIALGAAMLAVGISKFLPAAKPAASITSLPTSTEAQVLYYGHIFWVSATRYIYLSTSQVSGTLYLDFDLESGKLSEMEPPKDIEQGDRGNWFMSVDRRHFLYRPREWHGQIFKFDGKLRKIQTLNDWDGSEAEKRIVEIRSPKFQGYGQEPEVANEQDIVDRQIQLISMRVGKDRRFDLDDGFFAILYQGQETIHVYPPMPDLGNGQSIGELVLFENGLVAEVRMITEAPSFIARLKGRLGMAVPDLRKICVVNLWNLRSREKVELYRVTSTTVEPHLLVVPGGAVHLILDERQELIKPTAETMEQLLR